MDSRDLMAGGQARGTASLVQPRYVFIREQIRLLACGDLVMEPALGVVRVAAVRRSEGRPFIRVAWRDDHGPCTAAVRYPADTVLPVRSPARADRLLVGHGIDRATYVGSEIDSRTARLIAAHLYRWPGSALYRFAVTGKVRGRIWDELDQLARDCRPFLRPWVNALAKYCRAWRTGGIALEGVAKAPTAPTIKPMTMPLPNNKQRSAQARFPELLARKTVRSELALELIDAAFALGLKAGQSGSRTAAHRTQGAKRSKAKT